MEFESLPCLSKAPLCYNVFRTGLIQTGHSIAQLLCADEPGIRATLTGQLERKSVHGQLPGDLPCHDNDNF